MIEACLKDGFNYNKNTIVTGGVTDKIQINYNNKFICILIYLENKRMKKYVNIYRVKTNKKKGLCPYTREY